MASEVVIGGLTSPARREPGVDSRRDFLRQAAVFAALGFPQVCAAENADVKPNEKMKPGDIDAHSHIWTTDLETYPLADGQTVEDLQPRSFTAEELLELIGRHGVTRVVLIQHKPYHGLDNRYITDTIAKYPGRFSAVACIEAAAEHPEREMERLQGLGVRGFRIRPGEGGTDRWRDSAGMCRMWEYGAKARLALCPLINPEDLPQVDEMCRRYPDTPVVVDHFARIGVDGTIHEKDLARLVALAKHKQAHVKVSAFYALGRKQPPYTDLIPMIQQLHAAYGPERLMWASDSPYQLGGSNTYGDSIALIRERIDFLSADDREWLLRKTAEKVYFEGTAG